MARCLRFCYCCCLFRLFVRLFVCLFVCSAWHKKVAQHCPNETLVSAAYIHPVCVYLPGERVRRVCRICTHTYTRTYIHTDMLIHMYLRACACRCALKRHFEALRFAASAAAAVGVAARAVAISAHQWTNDSGDILEHITLVKVRASGMAIVKR